MQVTRMKVADLSHYHKNARVGNVPRVVSSLKANGQYKPIVVNVGTHTGRPMEVAAGNHVLKAARELGWEHIDVVQVDLHEPALIRLVLADNKTSDDSSYDARMLDDILSELAEYEVEDLEGSGYTMEDVDDVALEAAEAFEQERTGGGEGPTISDVLKGQNAVVSFTIVFDDADQRRVWDAWVKRLREDGGGRTLGALITEAVEDL